MVTTLTGHKKRFAGWQKKMPVKTQYLVEQVLTRIVPEFEKQGFVWYADYADNNSQEIGANEIPLQKREGEEWPTVQLNFLKGVWGPRFRVDFACLPEFCRNPLRKHIPRQQAVVVYGRACFTLRRGKWSDHRDFIFGRNWMLLVLSPSSISRLIRYLVNWRKFLDSEIDEAISLLPLLFDVFDKGIPQEWLEHERGRVTANISLIHSWKIWEKQQAKAGSV